MNNYLQGSSLLVLSWAAALIFAMAGLTTLFFGFQGYCHIENCPIKVYPMGNAAADVAADAKAVSEEAGDEAKAKRKAADQAKAAADVKAAPKGEFKAMQEVADRAETDAVAAEAVFEKTQQKTKDLQDKVQLGAVTSADFTKIVKKAFNGNQWAPLITAGLYLIVWLALGFFVFLNHRRLLLSVVFLHVIVIIYAFLAYLLIGNKVTTGDANVPLIFLVPPVVGGFASVFYFFLREYFLREHRGLKERLGLIEKELQILVDSLRQIHFINRKLQQEAPIELIIESGHTSPVVIDHLEQVLKDNESTRAFDSFNDEESLIADTLFHSQLTIDELSRVYPGQVQKLNKDHGSLRQLLQDFDALDTWVGDAKNAITEGSRQLAAGIDEASKDILSRHPEIPHDQLLKEFLEEELSLRIDRRIPSINSVDFPWSDKRGSL